MNYTSADTVADLIINRLSRDIYNDLSAQPGKLDENQLYLIDGEDFDVFNKRIVNVKPPSDSTDAVTLGYIDEKYVRQGNISSYIDNSRIYGERLAEKWKDGETYIDGRLGVYKKDCKTSSPNWTTAVVKGTVDPSSVTVKWQSGMGWYFAINGVMPEGTHYSSEELIDTLYESFTYNGVETEVSATCWHKTDTLVSAKQIYGCLSSITSGSTTANIAAAIVKLNGILSAL